MTPFGVGDGDGWCARDGCGWPLLLCVPAFEDQGGVGAAEAEGIGEGVGDFGFTGDIGNVVEVAGRVGLFVIGGGRHDLVTECEDADAGFEAAGAAEQVAGHGFRGADGNFFGAVAEDAFERGGFDGVADGSGGAVSVDVADVVGGDAGIFQGGVRDAIAAVAAFGGLSDVVGVTGHTVADNFGENIRAAFLGDFEGFENHDAGAFADDEAVAVGFEGAAGVFRVFIVRGQGAHGGKTADAHGGDGGFGAAGDHDVGGAALDNFEGVADGVGRRGAGGRRGGIGTLGAVTNRDVAGSEIDDGGRNEKRGNLSGAAGEIFGMFALDNVETADAGADVNAGGIGEFGRDGERG